MKEFTFGQLQKFLAEINIDFKYVNCSDDLYIKGFSSISDSKEGTVTWMREQEIDFSSVSASVVICACDFTPPVDHVKCFVKVKNPRLVFAKILQRFGVERKNPTIAATAAIGKGCSIGQGVTVGEYTVINNNVMIGDHSEIRSHVVITEGVKIGSNCLIKSGTIIGEEGFGFDYEEDGTPVRIPHIGSVSIGDNVEIGALNTICRGTLRDTVIEDWAKTDDHVHVAHNVQIGCKSLLTACVEVSGSVTISEGVWVGPNSTIIDGIELGKKSFIGAGCNVLRSVEEGAVIAGIPGKKIKKTT